MYEPNWGDAILAYATKYLAKNAWRTSPLYELDDLLQEAYLLFVRLVERYEFVGPNHFMAMWKRSLHNLIVNAAKFRTRRREQPLPENLTRLDRSFREVDWKLLLEDAPPAVRQLVTSIEGHSAYGRKPSHQKLAGGVRETTGAFLCRRAGLSYDGQFRQQFENWLCGE
jgi:DNA-directed RNA polymerase specialized sigma24 family protein